MRSYNKDPVHFENFQIALDSGAHSIYIENFVTAEKGKTNAAARQNANYNFADSQVFKDYLETYIAFLHENKDSYDFYVTLDVIANPKKTLEVTHYIESCGLKPMPVFHVGSDLKFLKQMLDRYDYIGIGGLGQDVSKLKYRPFADAVFKLICDEKGTPRVKTHGFAMTSIELISNYPWYSCDSSTWTSLSRNGTVYMPKPIFNGNEVIGYDFSKNPYMLPLAHRRSETDKRHIDHQPPLIKAAFEHYFNLHDVTFEMARNGRLGYDVRDFLNIRFFVEFEKRVKELYQERYEFGSGGNIYLAGNPSGASTNRTSVVELFGFMKEPSLKMLGTFYYPRPNDNLLNFKKCTVNGIDLRTLQKPPKLPKSRPKPKLKLPERTTAIAFDVEVRYRLEYTAKKTHYDATSLKDITQAELASFLATCEHQFPTIALQDIQVTGKLGDERVSVTQSQLKESPEPEQQGFLF